MPMVVSHLPRYHPKSGSQATHPFVTMPASERLRRICANHNIKPYDLGIGWRHTETDPDMTSAMREVVLHFKHWGWSDIRIAELIGNCATERVRKFEGAGVRQSLPYFVPVDAKYPDKVDRCRELIQVR